jgi:hypothetical protein
MSLDSDIGGTSPPRYRDFPPFSQRSRSTFDRVPTGEENDTEDDELDASPKLPESVLAIRKMAKEKGNRASESAIVDETPQTPFMKPIAKARKFVWIHLPFNNPTWVTVSGLPLLTLPKKKAMLLILNTSSLFFKRCKSRTSETFLLCRIATSGSGGTRVVGMRSIMRILQSQDATLRRLELVSGP